jgi:hypothetical protein
MTEEQIKEEWEKLRSTWDSNYPHCEPRVLHHPSECVHCADEKYSPLHDFRERVGMNYTGHTDRPFPCIGENERGLKSINSWYGNISKTQAQLDEQSKMWIEAFEEFYGDDNE